MIKKIKMRNDIVQTILKNTSNVYTVTGGMGIEYKKEKRFFKKAQESATKKATITDGNIKWVPFFLDPKTSIICGIKNSKNIKTEIDLINGLITEIKYDYFLENQVEEFIDPKSKFIRSLLLSDDLKSFEQAIEKGDIIGVNLRSPQAVIIAEVPGLFKKIHKQIKTSDEAEINSKILKECHKITAAISAGFKNYDQNIIGCLEPDRFVILKWADGEVNTLNTIKFYKQKSEYVRNLIEKQTGLTTTTAVGQYYPGLKGLKKSYHDALSTLELGKKIWGEGKAYHIVDIGMYVSLAEDISFERKSELAHQLLGDVIKDKDLYKTMKTFLNENMNLTDAAKKLHLHRNTLIYRLDKIKRELGLDPRKFSDAVHIKLGLMLYSPNIKKCDTKNTPK